MEIDSPANPRIRAAVALRERRERDRTGLTLVDGGRESLRAIEADVVVESAFVCLPLVTSTDAAAAVALLRATGADIVPVSERAFAKVVYGDRAEGVVLVVRSPDTSLTRLRLGDDPLLVVTELVEKPGNLGAILRSADGAGADVLIAVGGTDLFNPNVVRASIGTVFTLPVAAADATTVVAWLRARQIRIVAARVDADRLHTDADLTGPLALVLGSEATGLSAAWDGAGVEAVRLPMLGAADSLNVAATAAVLLYEARRQRSSAGPQSA